MWALLSFWLWTLTCPHAYGDISCLLTHAWGLTIWAKPWARTCQPGNWRVEFCEVTAWSVPQKRHDFCAWEGRCLFCASASVFPWRWPAGLSSWGRACSLWLLLPLFPSTLGMLLRGLVNNQRKVSQDFGSPFILLITLCLMSYIFLTYRFLCSCPLRCYSQFQLKQYFLNKRIIVNASAQVEEGAF